MSMYQIERVGLLKIYIEGGEFGLLSEEEDLRWLDQVEQIVLEVHGDHGDAAALIARLESRGFLVSLRDNDGKAVSPYSKHLDYAYCRQR